MENAFIYVKMLSFYLYILILRCDKMLLKIHLYLPEIAIFRDGCSRSGVICTVIRAIDQIKTQNHVDVFRAIKDLRDMRPNMVNSFVCDINIPRVMRSQFLVTVFYNIFIL